MLVTLLGRKTASTVAEVLFTDAKMQMLRI